jgi:predicted glycogen debranching enzyme
MLPNRFTDDGSGAEYNSVDASLWFFVAVHYYLAQTGDLAFIEREILPALREIQHGYEKGTRYGIHQSAEGLLYAGEPGVQLTWMDAKVGDHVITPRIGAPVEINALWYNALRILAELEAQGGVRREAVRCRKSAEKVKEAFLRSFWNEELGCLFDCINGTEIDAAVRPNQLFAISLPYPLLTNGRARKVLQIIEERLYTPVGLRSLDPHHPDYRGRYDGDVWSRDSAYHQGTVWSWLLGPYITALVRFGGDNGRRKATQAINEFRLHLTEAGIGTVSEIFDGDAPYTPQGCIAQAWGVAEVLRAYVEDVYQVTSAGDEGADRTSIALT